MAYYNSNNKKKNNHYNRGSHGSYGSHGGYKPQRSNCTSSIISAIVRANSSNVITYYEAKEMMDHVTQRPYMRNCSQGIHSIINACKRNVVTYYEAKEQIWNLLRHS